MKNERLLIVTGDMSYSYGLFLEGFAFGANLRIASFFFSFPPLPSPAVPHFLFLSLSLFFRTSTCFRHLFWTSTVDPWTPCSVNPEKAEASLSKTCSWGIVANAGTVFENSVQAVCGQP